MEGSLACVEILGRSVLERTIERLCRMGVQIISVVMDEASSNLNSTFRRPLSRARDLRRLVVDALQGRCQLSPKGREIKPRVWVDDGAQLHRRARVVAPAYIGRASSVREDTLITRFSNVESFCEVDYGTAIEDSSVLSNSYVGIWLDVSHAVVCGSKLLNLSRNATLNLADCEHAQKKYCASQRYKSRDWWKLPGAASLDH